MKDKKNIVLCLSLVILLIFTLLLFFGIGNNSKSGMQIVSIIFILITELLVFGNIFLFRFKKFDTFLVAGLSSSVFLYTICSLIFNIFLLGIFKTVKSILIFNFSVFKKEN